MTTDEGREARCEHKGLHLSVCDACGYVMEWHDEAAIRAEYEGRYDRSWSHYADDCAASPVEAKLAALREAALEVDRAANTHDGTLFDALLALRAAIAATPAEEHHHIFDEIAAEAAALTRREPLDVERLAVIEAMEREGVVQWGDEGHRERFLAMLPARLAALAAEYARLEAADKT